MFGHTLGVGGGQGGLACCDSWDRKESDTTERVNLTELKTSWDVLPHEENIFKNTVENWYHFFLNSSIEFTSKTPGPGDFIFGNL